MNDIKTIVKTIVTNEIDQDHEAVKNDSFVLAPYLTYSALKGNGTAQEVATDYQLDIFFKNKGELIYKSKQLIEALDKYPLDGFVYTYESNVRLWRGTTTIEKL